MNGSLSAKKHIVNPFLVVLRATRNGDGSMPGGVQDKNRMAELFRQYPSIDTKHIVVHRRPCASPVALSELLCIS